MCFFFNLIQNFSHQIPIANVSSKYQFAIVSHKNINVLVFHFKVTNLHTGSFTDSLGRCWSVKAYSVFGKCCSCCSLSILSPCPLLSSTPLFLYPSPLPSFLLLLYPPLSSSTFPYTPNWYGRPQYESFLGEVQGTVDTRLLAGTVDTIEMFCVLVTVFTNSFSLSVTLCTFTTHMHFLHASSTLLVTCTFLFSTVPSQTIYYWASSNYLLDRRNEGDR